MVASKERARKKMEERVATAGSYLKEGMEEAEDPVDILLKDPEKYGKQMVDGLQNAVQSGRYKGGLERAKQRGSYKRSTERAANHYSERAGDMAEHAMEDYDARAAAIKRAQDAIRHMPKATYEQRKARMNKYNEVIHQEMNKLYGRK